MTDFERSAFVLFVKQTRDQLTGPDYQLALKLREPTQLDIDGYVDSRGVRYLGKAVQQFDGTWHALADVFGCLCLVEVRITPLDPAMVTKEVIGG